MRSLSRMWISLVAMKTWMRGCAAPFSASQARSTSSSLVRANPQMIGLRTAATTAFTARSRLRGDREPASITST
jgi:hypothetical protein